MTEQPPAETADLVAELRAMDTNVSHSYPKDPECMEHNVVVADLVSRAADEIEQQQAEIGRLHKEYRDLQRLNSGLNFDLTLSLDRELSAGIMEWAFERERAERAEAALREIEKRAADYIAKNPEYHEHACSGCDWCWFHYTATEALREKGE